MSAPSFGSVVGGKLKLKKPGAAPVSAASGASGAPQRGAAAQMAGERLAGAKRKAPPAADAPTAAARALEGGDATVVVALSDAPIQTVPVNVGGKTPAQRAHEEALERRKKELSGKMASKSHREKVEAMNEYLAKLPAHNDLFKISYGGQG